MRFLSIIEDACSAFAKVIAETDRTFPVESYGFFCINFPASFSIWVHCARRTITHLDIARLASDMPRAYRYRVLSSSCFFHFSPHPSFSVYLVLTVCKSLSLFLVLFLHSLSPLLFLSFSPSLLSTFSTNKVLARPAILRGQNETSSINPRTY